MSERRHQIEVLSRQYTALFQNYIRPLLFGQHPGVSQSLLLKNGTITFVSIKTRCFGITNWHVVDEFQKMRANDSNTICQIGEKGFDICSRLVDKDKTLDLAAIEFSMKEIQMIGASPLDHSDWPVRPAKQGETAFIIGCPGELRTVDTPDQLTAPYVNLIMPIESVSDTKIAFHFKREFWHVTKGSNDPAQIKDWGGISGGGVFVMREIFPELIGVTFEYNSAFELLYCTRSDFIKEDGTIRRE